MSRSFKSSSAVDARVSLRKMVAVARDLLQSMRYGDMLSGSPDLSECVASLVTQVEALGEIVAVKTERGTSVWRRDDLDHMVAAEDASVSFAARLHGERMLLETVLSEREKIEMDAMAKEREADIRRRVSRLNLGRQSNNDLLDRVDAVHTYEERDAIVREMEVAAATPRRAPPPASPQLDTQGLRDLIARKVRGE